MSALSYSEQALFAFCCLELFIDQFRKLPSHFTGNGRNRSGIEDSPIGQFPREFRDFEGFDGRARDAKSVNAHLTRFVLPAFVVYSDHLSIGA